MTYVNSADKTVMEEFQKYRERNLAALERYASIPEIPSDLTGILSVLKTLNKYVRDLEQVRPGKYNCTAVDDVTEKYKRLVRDSDTQRTEIRNRYARQREDRKTSHESEVTAARNFNASLDAEMRKLHKELCDFKGPMKAIFERYSITPLDTAITSATTEEDFKSMLQCSIALCEKYVHRDDDLLKKDLDHLQDDDFSVAYILAILAVAIVLIYLSLPFLSVAFFAKLFITMHNHTNDIDGLRLASALMSEIDYARFIPPERYRQVSEISMDDIEEEEKKALESVTDYSMEYMSAEEEARKAQERVMQDQAQFQKEFDSRRVELLRLTRSKLQEALARRDQLLKETVMFPHNQNLSSVMRHTYVLSRTDGCIDVTTDVGINNLTFDDSDRASALQTMKLYLVNALLSVKPGNLRVEILDSATQCRDFTDFFDNRLDFIKPCKKGITERVNEYREAVSENIKSFRGMTMDEMNQSLEADERICKPYDLLIIIDPVAKLYERNEGVNTFESFLEYSASMGTFIWLLDTVHRKHTTFVSRLSQQGDVVPVSYSSSMGTEMMSAFAQTYAAEKKKIAVLPYFDTYFNKVYPPDKIWKFNTIKGIEVNFGYADGDPSRPESLVFGDDNVHAILVGGTGSGKSATINQIIATLISKYPPSELIINFIDLKNAEASKFSYKAAANDRDKTIPEVITEEMLEHSRVPHMNILSGTSDGAYALSIIESLLKEMKRRQRLCADNSVLKIEDLRKKNPEMVVPRILTIIDEFQQMFNRETVPPRIMDQIMNKLDKYVKLARAFGGHLLLASQSMTGTLSNDVLANFRLRCALSCDSSVSNAVLGNNASSLLPPKGYIYTNATSGVSASANRLWRIPFLDTDDLLRHIESLNARLSENNEGSHNAVLYDESRMFGFEELDKVYAKYPSLLEDSNVFVLGEYTSYTDSKIPYTIRLKNDASENIVAAAFDKIDLLNITCTLLENLRLKQVKIIINVQDRDTCNMLEPVRYVPEELLDVASPDTSPVDVMSAVEDLIVGRADSGETEFSPVFVCLLLWDRVSGIGDFKMEARLNELLKLGPVYNVHFILACGAKGELSRSTARSCIHIITGKQTDTDNLFFMEDAVTTKYPSRDSIETQGNFAAHKIADKITKFKIYQRDYKNGDSSRVVTIE